MLCSCPSPQQLTENLSSLVWSTSPDHAKTLVAMGNTEFVDTLNSALVSVPRQCAGVECRRWAPGCLLKETLHILCAV